MTIQPPEWAWWRDPAQGMNLRFASAILLRAGELETGIFAPAGKPLDAAVQDYQRANKSMGRQDRMLLGVAVYALARNRDVLRVGFPGAPTGEGRFLLLALLDALQCPPEDIPGLPGHSKEWLAARKRVNAQRAAWVQAISGRETCRLRPATDRRAPADAAVLASAETLAALAGLFAVPAWWLTQGPWPTVGAAVRELAVLKRPQKLVLRVQVNRGSRDEALQALADLKIPVFPTARSPWGIVVDGRHNVLASQPYRDGLVEVQDEGSQLVACLCDPKPTEKVLDLCAGGGGKTLALAAVMKGKGQVLATD
ncbi:MAG TPA: hypothetical protein PKM88_10235, partial [bacterium]|nr:hypothetical protein [bacterium]